MSGHTPGPWHYEGANEGGRVLAMDDRATIIHQPPCNPFNEQVVADARLIAAAPELLEALERMASTFSPFPRHDTEGWREETEACELARAAIAKATQP